MEKELSLEDWENLYASGEIAFTSIPRHKFTQKIWYIAALKGDVKVEEIPILFQNQEFFDLYFNQYCDITQVPKKFQTQEMANKEFEIYQDIKRIPRQFQTQEMSNVDFAVHQDIKRIPGQFQTQEMADIDFKEHHDIKRIFYKFQTQEMANIDFTEHQNILRIPYEFQDQEMADIDFMMHQDIERIPYKFQTQEMANIYFLKTCGESYVPERFLAKLDRAKIRILKEIQTQEMANNDFEIHQDITRILRKFQTQEMADKDFSIYYDVTRFSKRLQTEEMFVMDFKIHQNLTRIPREFQTQEMADKDFEEHQDITRIPREFQTQEMSDKDFMVHQDIRRISKKYQTLEMLSLYKENAKDNSNFISEILVSDSPLISAVSYFFKTFDLDKIPNTIKDSEFYNIVVERVKKDENSQNIYKKLNDDLKYMVLKSELINLVETGGTKEEIEEKYNISSIDWVINRLEKDDPDLFKKVKKLFEENANTWFQTMLVDIINLRTIIQNLGDLNPNKLTPEQKINFAYNLSKAGTHHSLAEINEFLERYPMYGDEDFTSVQSFFRHHLNFKYKKMAKSDEVALYDNEKYLAQNGQNWLRKFDLNETFKVKDGKPIATLKYLTPDGEALELTIDKANEILDYLKENEVPLRSCIVNEAFRRYARGELDNFINELENGYGEKTK